jgi:hypothetical protein
MFEKKFYRNVVEVIILSEEPLHLGGENILSEIESLITFGDCSGRIETTVVNEEVDSATMAKLLQEQGSDPSFFMLDDDGNNIEDEE